MKFTELLERAGDKLKHQRLDECLVSVRQKKAHGEVTFWTEAYLAEQLAQSSIVGKAPDYVGIVVWIPASAFNPPEA